MGISPLVLATEPVKDLKTTIVSVALPGQGRSNGGSPLPIPVSQRVNRSSLETRTDDVEELASGEEMQPEVIDPVVESVPVPTVPVEFVNEEPLATENESDSYPETSAPYPETSADATRRRRRRRSALLDSDTAHNDVG
jgi:ribonuclease E